MKTVLKGLNQSVLMPLGLMEAKSTTGAVIQKIYGSGMTALINSNEVIEDIMKIFKSLEESCFLIKGPSKIIENHTKKQNGGNLSMMLTTLEATMIFIIF